MEISCLSLQVQYSSIIHTEKKGHVSEDTFKAKISDQTIELYHAKSFSFFLMHI